MALAVCWKQHCHHPPLLSHNWRSGWRLLAPLAESLVGEDGTRHSMYTKSCHSDTENIVTPCIIICLNYHFCVDPSRKEGIPKYLCWRQGSGGVAVGWRRPPTQCHLTSRPTGCQTRKQLPPSPNTCIGRDIYFTFFILYFDSSESILVTRCYELHEPDDKFGILSSGHVTGIGGLVHR